MDIPLSHYYKKKKNDYGLKEYYYRYINEKY